MHLFSTLRINGSHSVHGVNATVFSHNASCLIISPCLIISTAFLMCLKAVDDAHLTSRFWKRGHNILYLFFSISWNYMAMGCVFIHEILHVGCQSLSRSQTCWFDEVLRFEVDIKVIVLIWQVFTVVPVLVNFRWTTKFRFYESQILFRRYQLMSHGWLVSTFIAPCSVLILLSTWPFHGGGDLSPYATRKLENEG